MFLYLAGQPSYIPNSQSSSQFSIEHAEDDSGGKPSSVPVVEPQPEFPLLDLQATATQLVSLFRSLNAQHI